MRRPSFAWSARGPIFAPIVALLLTTRPAECVRHACAVGKEGTEIVFDCGGELISAVDFSSYGRPRGECEANSELMKPGTFQRSSQCHAPRTDAVLEDRCLGQATCIFTVTGKELFGQTL